MPTRVENLLIGTQTIAFTVEDVTSAYEVVTGDILLRYHGDQKQAIIHAATTVHVGKTPTELLSIYAVAGCTAVYLFKPAT